MKENEIRNYSENWYTLGRSFLAELGTERFARMAGQANSFTYEVVGETEAQVKIVLTDKVQTAAVDMAKDVIYISTNYFSPSLYTERYPEGSDKKLEELAIALINGSVVHEALHLRHTPKSDEGTIPGTMKQYGEWEYRKYIDKYGANAVHSAYNIIEDIYIEGQVATKLETWLQACSDILFPRSSLDSIDLELATIEDYLNLAILFKNKALRDDERFNAFPPIAKRILDKFARSIARSERSRVGDTYKFLDAWEAPEPDESEGESEDSDDEETGDEETGDAEGSETAEGETSKAKGGSSSGEGDESEGEMVPAEIKEILDKLEEMSEEDFTKFSEEIEEASEEVAEKESSIETYKYESDAGYKGKLSWPKLVEKDVLEVGRGYATIKPECNINFGFLKEIAAIRTLNRTPGAARKSGSVMVKSRLTRIATDGKIFAKRDAERKTLKRIEVIINVDFSGSTSGTVADTELGSAMEISKVLRSAGIAHSVYGHTSSGRRTPLLIHIYSYDMETTNQDWDKRFEAARKVRLAENFDGVVINRLGEKFTGKQASQYIINLSDGTPCGPGYIGEGANGHTKQQINKLREVGIGVFSISVVSGVVVQNNKIYGEDFNIDGSKNTASQFRRLIKKLVS